MALKIRIPSTFVSSTLYANKLNFYEIITRQKRLAALHLAWISKYRLKASERAIRSRISTSAVDWFTKGEQKIQIHVTFGRLSLARAPVTGSKTHLSAYGALWLSYGGKYDGNISLFVWYIAHTGLDIRHSVDDGAARRARTFRRNATRARSGL